MTIKYDYFPPLFIKLSILAKITSLRNRLITGKMYNITSLIPHFRSLLNITTLTKLKLIHYPTKL